MIADFDGTLTRYWIDGCRGQSMLLIQPLCVLTRDAGLPWLFLLWIDTYFSYLTDFDCYWLVASHGLLQQSDPVYDAKRQALYEYYHPLEYSPTIPIDEKTKLMEEW